MAIGSNEYIEQLIAEHSCTFEAARDMLYDAIDKREVHLTPHWCVAPGSHVGQMCGSGNDCPGDKGE